MSTEIRKAAIDELDLLMEWRMTVLREVFSVPDENPLDELELENRRYYQNAIKNDTHIACFAYDGDQVVGCGGVCFYQEMPSPDNPTGQCAYLMNIYTHPALRDRGIGRSIVQWLVQQAERRNITKIYLETSKAGRRLYDGMGFVPMSDMMKWVKEEVRIQI